MLTMSAIGSQHKDILSTETCLAASAGVHGPSGALPTGHHLSNVLNAMVSGQIVTFQGMLGPMVEEPIDTWAASCLFRGTLKSVSVKVKSYVRIICFAKDWDDLWCLVQFGSLKWLGLIQRLSSSMTLVSVREGGWPLASPKDVSMSQHPQTTHLCNESKWALSVFLLWEGHSWKLVLRAWMVAWLPKRRAKF